MFRPSTISVLALAAALAAPAVFARPAVACDVPVFRYALERWAPDPFDMIVFHRGPLSGEPAALLASLRPEAGGLGSANVQAVPVDLDGAVDKDAKALWAAQGGAALPRFVVRNRDGEVVTAGKFQRAAVTAALESPARRELVRRLVAGDSVVWIVLESGDKARDDAVAKRLSDELAELAKSVKLPSEEGDEKVDLLSEIPLKIAFSVLRVARSDPVERGFVADLFGAEKSTAAMTEPTVFPVFGRGRVLEGLTDREIEPRDIRDATLFLCGACSCRVKRLSPGRDLLLCADWESLLGGPPAAPRTAERTAAPTEPTLVPIPKSAPVLTPCEPPAAALQGPTDSAVASAGAPVSREFLRALLTAFGVVATVSGAYWVRTIYGAGRGGPPA